MKDCHNNQNKIKKWAFKNWKIKKNNGKKELKKKWANFLMIDQKL